MNDEPFLIDTNVLVYAYDTSDRTKHERAKNILKDCWKNQNSVLSAQNLAEFYVTVTKKIAIPLPQEKAKTIILDYLAGFEILTYNGKTVAGAVTMNMTHRTPFWDALIAATMQEHRITTILTENEKDFKKIKGITIINPFKKK